MTYTQHEGLDMGAPVFSIFSEFYLQYQENSKIYDLPYVNTASQATSVMWTIF